MAGQLWTKEARRVEEGETTILVNAIMNTFEFSLNYQQHKVGISANYIFPFISFVKFIKIIRKFGRKYYLIF